MATISSLPSSPSPCIVQSLTDLKEVSGAHGGELDERLDGEDGGEEVVAVLGEGEHEGRHPVAVLAWHSVNDVLVVLYVVTGEWSRRGFKVY